MTIIEQSENQVLPQLRQWDPDVMFWALNPVHGLKPPIFYNVYSRGF